MENGPNYMIGFNNRNQFSDFVIHLEVMPEYSLPRKPWNPKRLKRTLDCSNESVHVTSLMLAARSPFFEREFNYRMMQPKGREWDITLKVTSSEKIALMDLLKYMYGCPLSANTSSDLLDVLIAADKYEVSCCVKCCVELLLKIPMSLDSALSYLELPSTISAAQVAQPLVDASKQYIVARYEDFNQFRIEALELPLNAIELLLGYEGLQVTSEDVIYDFIKDWARANYPKREERRKVVSEYLMQFICFRNLTCLKLNEALNRPDAFDREQVNNLNDALFDKVGQDPYGRHLRHSSKVLTTTESRFRGRLYRLRLVKVVYIEFPSPSCVVYFDLSKKECENLPSARFFSEPIILDERTFRLVAICSRDQHRLFSLLLVMDGSSEACTSVLEIAVRKSTKFVTCFEDNNCTLTKLDGRWVRNLFGIPWGLFINNHSEHFIDGILHLRVNLTIVGSQG